MSPLRLTITALYQVAMLAGSLWCHQRPERSPHLWGVQLPLCWRCSGILLGALALFCWLIVRKRLPAPVASLILALLMPLDALTAVAGLWGGDNMLRLITGLLWGIFGTSLALHLARYGYVYSRRNVEGSDSSSSGDPARASYCFSSDSRVEERRVLEAH